MTKQVTGSLRMGPGTHEVPLQLFNENRTRLCRALEASPRTPPQSVVLLQGGETINFYDTDTDYVFRQEPYFMWAFGVTEPGFYGAIDVTSGVVTLFAPRLPDEYAVWMGPLLSREDFREKYQVDQVHYVDEMKDELMKTTNAVLLVMKGENTDSKLPVKPAYFKGIEDFNLNKEVLFPIIAELRVTKTALELNVLRYVARISSEAHKEVMRAVRADGKYTEYQAEAKFLAYCYAVGGCRHVSYTCICGSGCNSAILHYGHAGQPNRRVLKDGDMCLFDMGANYHGYAADITCSFPVSGIFTDAQRLIYSAVLASNRAVHSSLRPGVSWLDMHLLAARVLLQQLAQGGLLQGSVDDMMACHLHATFMPHGLGHLLGIDVHDVGGYTEATPPRPTEPGVRALRTARVLQEGMVVTVEPGCYFIKPLLDAAKDDPKLSRFLVLEELEKFNDFGGVRIEDDVIITNDGVENITLVPRTIEEIEAWMAGRDY